MSTDPLTTLEARLTEFRERFAADGPLSLRGMDSSWDELSRQPPTDDDALGQARFYEILAYDALAIERPGWAYVCMRAAEASYVGSESGALATAAKRSAQAILEACFPPYDDDAAVLRDVRRWLWARAAQLKELPGVDEALRKTGPDRPDPVRDRAVGLKHRWLFRLVRTRQVGRVFRFDQVMARFPLTQEDQLLLRVLAAAHGDRLLAHVVGADHPGELPLTVGWLAELVADNEAELSGWVRRFDGRAPLRRFGLVYVEPARSLEEALRGRHVELDESLVAAAEGRDYWPAELAGLVTLHLPPGRPANAREEATARALQELGSTGHVHLISGSADASAGVVRTWSSKRLSGEVLAASPEALARADVRRAVARQARLRSALVLVSGPVADGDAEALAALLPDPLVHHHDRGSWTFGVEHPAPARAEAPLLWNAALSEAGLAEIAEASVHEHLAPLGLDEADIRAVVRMVTAHGPRVEAAALAEVASRISPPPAPA